MNPLILLTIASAAVSTAALVQSSSTKEDNAELDAQLKETKRLLSNKTDELALVIEDANKKASENTLDLKSSNQELLEKIALLSAALAALKDAPTKDPVTPPKGESEGEDEEGK